jgi:flagellar biosynthesis protein
MSESNGKNLGGLKAAALRYTAGQDAAPIVVAAGTGYVAQKILEIADECGVNVYHDDSAATLLSKLNLGQAIPPELYQMVVDIYITVLNAAEQSKTQLLAPKRAISPSPMGNTKEIKEEEQQHG